MPEVLIIESRSPTDFFSNRSEAETLTRVLKLGEIQARFLEALDYQHLSKAINKVTDPVKYVHISAHGNKNGFTLTDGTEVDWAVFQNLVQERFKGKYLIFSSCEVARGVRRLFDIDETFCRAIVAPTRKIDWGEGLIAYSAFYHRALNVAERTTASVKVLNSITEPRTFKCFYNPTL